MPRLRPLPGRQEEPPQPIREIIPAPGEEPPEGQDHGGARFESGQEDSPTPAPSPKPKSTPKAEPKEDESLTALQRQIEALKNSEAELRRQNEEIVRQRQEAIRQAQQYQQDVFKHQREVLENQELAVGNALAAAQAAAEKAESDIAAAVESGDHKAQAEAYRRLARAESDISKFESAKSDFDAQKKTLEEASKQQPQQQQQYPQIAIDWLEAHPDYKGGYNNKRLQAAFMQAVEDGYQPYTKAQIARMEELLDLSDKTEDDALEEDDARAQPAQNQQKRQASMVSAPVSRQSGSGGRSDDPSKIKLTPEQREAAAMAGITEAEYARQLVTMNKYKANGLYGENR